MDTYSEHCCQENIVAWQNQNVSSAETDANSGGFKGASWDF